ncbi:MAG TPA: aldo/keto reductase [Rhodanobacteraceae bacterium]|nr:aldo/keto reductase [Rhodanobacteraceae bacterium]
MEKRTLGRSNLEVSLVGLGCNNFGARIDLAASRKVVDAALDHGITLFDTADTYGSRSGASEEMLGQALGARRPRIVLATKFGKPMQDADDTPRGARRYVTEAAEASLRRLGTDWIDLYQMHEPDPATPIEQTLRALDDLVRAGKVRHVGCSNFPAWQVVEAQWTARHFELAGFVSCQDEYSLVERGIERDLLPAMQAYGLGLLPYFPLAGGLLTGKYRHDAPLPSNARFAHWKGLGERYLTETNWEIVGGLRRFAQERDRSLLDLAFSWLAARAPVASVIAGATTAEQIAQNVAAAQWNPGADELAEIDRLTARATAT